MSKNSISSEEEFLEKLKGKLIIFLGPVGVGKSTVIDVLTSYMLRSVNARIHRTFIKSFHGLSYALWVFIAKLLGLPRDYAPWYSVPMRGYVDVARILSLLSASIDALVNMPLKILIIKMLKLMGYTVISEEYLHSTIIDYLYTYAHLNIKSRLYTILPLIILYSLALKHKPDIAIILDSSMDEVMKRWTVRGYGDPQLKYIKMQNLLIRRLLKGSFPTLNAYVIDTSNMSVRETVSKVIKILQLEVD